MINNSQHNNSLTSNHFLVKKIKNEISNWSLHSSILCDYEINHQKNEVFLKVRDYHMMDLEKIQLLIASFIQETMNSLHKTFLKLSYDNKKDWINEKYIFPFFLTANEFHLFKKRNSALFSFAVFNKLEALQPFNLGHNYFNIEVDDTPFLVLHRFYQTSYDKLPLILHTDTSSVLNNTVIHYYNENDAMLNNPPDVLINPDGFEIGETVSVYRFKSQIKDFMCTASFPIQISIRLHDKLQLPLSHFIEIIQDFTHQTIDFLEST